MVLYLVIGALASFCLLAVTGSRLVLPEYRGRELSLGFLGHLVVGATSSLLIDHDPVVSFLGALAVLIAFNAPMWAARTRNGLEKWGDRQRLEMLRRKLKVAEDNLAMFGPGEAPLHLQIMVDEIKREIAELENEST